MNYGYASYAHSAEGIGNFAAGMHYVNYGTFDRTDELGVSQGTFRASEYALNLFYSRSFLDSALSAGVNLKPIFSSLEQYTSFGIAMDLGVTYYISSSLTSFGLVFKNMGAQITSYTAQERAFPLRSRQVLLRGWHMPLSVS